MSVILVLIILWLVIEWEWSTIDDPGLVIAAQSARDLNGIPGGILVRLNEAYEVDRSWGLFRPSYWLYQATVYQFPIPLPQVLRLLMVIVVLAGPLVFFARQGWRSSKLIFAFILIIAGAAPLMIGLQFISLQELSGAAFISVGLMVKSKSVRLLLWAVAALFKSPFAWIMYGEAIVLWRKGEKRWALANALVPTIILLTAWLWAREGDYTGGYGIDPNVMWENIPKLFQAPIYFLFIITLWWATAARAKLRPSESTILFGAALLGYATQMLPWSVTAYYAGPISFFLSLTLVSIVAQPHIRSKIGNAAAFALPVGLALLMVAWPIRQVLQTNTVLREITACLENETNAVVGLSGNMVYVTTSVEAPDRIATNLTLRNPNWNGSITLDNLKLSLLDPTTTHFVIVGFHETLNERQVLSSCEAGIATVYTLGPVD